MSQQEMLHDATTFTARFRLLRRETGLSMAEFGEKCGLDKSYISRLEQGKNVNLSREKIEKMCAVFAFNPNWLSHGLGEMKVAQATPDATIHAPVGVITPKDGGKKIFLFLVSEVPTEKLKSALEACEVAEDLPMAKAIGAELARRADKKTADKHEPHVPMRALPRADRGEE